MNNMENNLNFNKGQDNSKRSILGDTLEVKKRGPIQYTFLDGSVGFFNSVEELTKAIKEDRENAN